MRLRFWLLALDAIAARGGFGSPPYLWVLGRAAMATRYDPISDDAWAAMEAWR